MNVGKNESVTTTPVPRPTPAPRPAATPQPKIGGDTLQLGATPAPTPAPTPATPAATAAPATPAQRDPARQGGNILDDSVPRKAVDAVSGVAGASDGARAVKPAITAVQAASEAGKLGRLGGLGAKLATWGEKAVTFGSNILGKVSWLGPALGGLAKAAPFLGLGVAALDVGKAAIEQDPAKKERAQGMAVLSTVSGVAGMVGWAGAAGMAIGGVALAPLVVPALVIGGIATVAALADQFLLGGKISRGIVHGAKAVWGAITSL